MKVELVQTAGRDSDIMHNLERALAVTVDCAANTELVVFPEIHLTGFPDEDNIAALVEPLDGPAVSAVQRVARERDVSVVIGIAEADAGRYYGTTLLIVLDGIALKCHKTHLWTFDRGIPTLDDCYVITLWNGIRVGLPVCFGIKFPENARAFGQPGTELITVTSDSMDPYSPTHRTTIMACTMENQAYAVMVNRIGYNDGELAFAGGSAVADPYGQLLCEAGREECRQIVELDLGRLQDVRRDYRHLEERHLVLPGKRRGHPDGLRELLIP